MKPRIAGGPRGRKLAWKALAFLLLPGGLVAFGLCGMAGESIVAEGFALASNAEARKDMQACQTSATTKGAEPGFEQPAFVDSETNPASEDRTARQGHLSDEELLDTLRRRGSAIVPGEYDFFVAQLTDEGVVRLEANVHRSASADEYRATIALMRRLVDETLYGAGRPYEISVIFAKDSGGPLYTYEFSSEGNVYATFKNAGYDTANSEDILLEDKSASDRFLEAFALYLDASQADDALAARDASHDIDLDYANAVERFAQRYSLTHEEALAIIEKRNRREHYDAASWEDAILEYGAYVRL